MRPKHATLTLVTEREQTLEYGDKGPTLGQLVDDIVDSLSADGEHVREIRLQLPEK